MAHEEQLREPALSAYPPLLSHILSGKEFGPLLRDPNRAEHRDQWRLLIAALSILPPSSPQLAERFHTQWHVCHHFLRELVEDDDLLIGMLRVWLPRYQGPGLVLYRGENIDRFELGQVGSAWTDNQETAEMFASGLNFIGKGSLILRADAPASAIIAGPSEHSIYLGESEFTVDPRALRDIVTLKQFVRAQAYP